MYTSVLKYVFEGLAVSAGVFLVSTKSQHKNIATLGLIALTVSLTFFILDYFSPRIAKAARFGSGFGLGFVQVGGKTKQTGIDSDEVRRNKQQNRAVKEAHTEEEGCPPPEFAQVVESPTANLRSEILREITVPILDQTSACNMVPYVNTVERVEDYARVFDTSESYKVIPGQWAEQELISGYNESVVAGNTETAYWSGLPAIGDRVPVLGNQIH